jgi:hypothetical protein
MLYSAQICSLISWRHHPPTAHSHTQVGNYTPPRRSEEKQNDGVDTPLYHSTTAHRLHATFDARQFAHARIPTRHTVPSLSTTPIPTLLARVIITRL